MVIVSMAASYPTWWQGSEVPPPSTWAYVFEEFTGEDSAEHWALAAAIFIAQTRRRSGVGPTFSELFVHLLPDTDGLPGPFPGDLDFLARRRVIASFRGHAAIEWRRRGMISFDKGVMRSLRVGREFRARSRRRQLLRTAKFATAGSSSQLDSVHAVGCASESAIASLTEHQRASEEPGTYPPAMQRIVDRIAPDWAAIIEVNPGWYGLLERLDKRLAVIAPAYVVHQVKAKFGSLSFFALPSHDPMEYNEEFNEVIRAAEWESIEICEVCGASARQYTIRLWTWTLCAEHAAAKHPQG